MAPIGEYHEKIEPIVDTVPQYWRDASIILIYKKLNGSELGNYGLVSLTCIMWKIMERRIKNDLTDHLAECSVINNSQHDFTKGRSCLTNLLFLEKV